MSNLIFKGLTEVQGMRFNHIEGWFGEGKKAMLVRDIANIHGRDLKDINRNINNNISRLKKGIDLIDLKVGEYKSLSLELGYSNQSYANANNIYLLSERGYAKLLKILEDDF
ncbi:MAG: ORF6N domain-containing protein [Clostridium cochlearium]|uniref:Phage protein n=1 Tax=Clostridium cochlearium TaxID=1494 RepID=A0A2X2WBW8_CLOCO|nr:ORF6N domain-containing protein [Clostridium cochlearium]MDU1442079.1 ORF6N domain-containing protein [Clostridium cochlearium]SQB35481.1 phage protein [Clostridium cochlearium]